MKNTCISFVIFCISLVAFAQSFQPASRWGTPQKNITPANTGFPVALMNPGDTLMHVPLPGFYVLPEDAPYFNVYAIDLDNQGFNHANGFPDPDWGIFYSTDSIYLLPEEADADTAFFLAATSWFKTPVQADNWLTLGPVTLPPEGATLSWYVRCNPGFRDGYEVLAGNIGHGDYTEFFDVIYHRDDLSPNPNDATDTVWQKITVDIPADYNNGPLYIAFHHNALDMDILYIDGITLTVGYSLQNEEHPSSAIQVVPFCSQQDVLTFRITSADTYSGTLSLTDISGRTIMQKETGIRVPGITEIHENISGLKKGLYVWTFHTEKGILTGKIMI